MLCCTLKNMGNSYCSYQLEEHAAEVDPRRAIKSWAEKYVAGTSDPEGILATLEVLLESAVSSFFSRPGSSFDGLQIIRLF